MHRLLVMNDMHGNKVVREALLNDMNRLSRAINEVFDLWVTNDSAPTSPSNGAS